MKVYQEMSVVNFKGWSGSQDVIDMLKEKNLVERFDDMIEELYPEGIDEVALNDILRFEEVLEMLGLEEEDEEEDENEEL